MVAPPTPLPAAHPPREGRRRMRQLLITAQNADNRRTWQHPDRAAKRYVLTLALCLALLVGTPACRSDEKAPATELCPYCGRRRRSALSRSGPRRPVRLHRRAGHGLSGVFGAGGRTPLAGLCQGRRQGLGGIRSRRPRADADLGRLGPRLGPGEDGDPVLSLRRARSGHGPGPFPGTAGDRPPRPRAGRATCPNSTGRRPRPGRSSTRTWARSSSTS